MDFSNVYEDGKRAESYAKLEFPGTYYLAYRDIPEIVLKHVKGRKTIDFGCGTGRSTRFLKKCGFDAVGIDISKDMIKKAKELDPDGDYRLNVDDDFKQFEKHHYDLILSVFTFDNIPDVEKRIKLLKGLSNLLNKEGRIILINSTPEIYINEWSSFSTKDFPENRKAKSGEKVKIVMTDVEDKRPVEDIVWFNEDYSELFARTGLELIESHKPLAKDDEPYEWINETKIAPWIIYVLKKGIAQ
ncbi:MAG: class I SAM-dependent methyltransferase [Candidatus Zixiibacteriota bacterium]